MYDDLTHHPYPLFGSTLEIPPATDRYQGMQVKGLGEDRVLS